MSENEAARDAARAAEVDQAARQIEVLDLLERNLKAAVFDFAEEIEDRLKRVLTEGLRGVLAVCPSCALAAESPWLVQLGEFGAHESVICATRDVAVACQRLLQRVGFHARLSPEIQRDPLVARTAREAFDQLVGNCGRMSPDGQGKRVYCELSKFHAGEHRRGKREW
jgi:hypothetical protein